MPNSLHLLLICIILILPFTSGNSYPVALQPDTSYQTGVQIIFTTTFSSTSTQIFFIPYTSIMTTPSVNATLGIYGINFYMVGQTFGWNMRVSSVSTTTLTIQLYVYSSSSYMSYLKLCYLVSSNPYIDVNFIQYNFDPANDSIANNAIPDFTICSFLTCRQYSQTQTYTSKFNPKIITYLAGFYVNSLTNGTNSDFGLDLMPNSASLNSFNMTIRVYGTAEVQYVGYYYLSFDSAALNVLYQKAATYGTGSMGCYYSGCGGGGALSNTGFTTGATQVLAYTSTMFFMGIQKFVVKYSGTIVDHGAFDITAMAQNSDSKVGVTFSFTGNSNDRFTVSYSYFTFQTFYCLASGPDLYFLYNSNKCDSGCSSISQFFDSSGVCTPCGSTCYRCAGTASYCTACYNSQNRVLNGNACVCDVVGGFYNDMTSLICPSCHYSCLTCGGLTSSSCLTCNSLSNRYRLNNTCPCLTGYYDAGASLCVACHYTCKTATCSGSTSSTCKSCNSSAFRGPLTSGFACPCMTGYYDVTNVQQCSSCHYSCLTCSTTNTNCLSCDGATNFRSWVSASKTCPCMSGYFDNLVSICVKCDSTCVTCSGPFSFNCLTCDGTSAVNRVLSSTTCACANYFYQFNKTCVACHYSCYTCANNTAAGCLSCISTSKRTFSASTGQCLCNFGSVDVGILLCQTCSNACLSCNNNISACTSCHNNPGRYQAGTNCLCYSNYVDLTFNGVCTPCHYSCLTCFGGTSTTCSTCTVDRTLTTNACLCPVGKYDNGYSVTCDTCHVNCKTCSNGLISGCIGCQALYFRTLNPSPLGTCVCQGGYYQVNVLACSPCNSKCLTCTTLPTTCTSCDWTTNHRVITGAFTCDCDIGYYQSGAAACPACLASCRTCSAQSNNCTSCYSIRTLVNNTCFCNAGTFQTVAGVCMPCAASCKTCENSSTTCLTCPSNANRYQFGNTCPCNGGFFDSGVALCAACNYTCLNCTSWYSCSICPLSSFRTLQMSGLCPCDNGYYDNGNAICAKCSPYCLTCQTYSQCLSCVGSDNRQWNSLTLTCSCMPGYYDNGANSTCSACHYSCATCYAGTNSNCYTCTSFRTFTMPYTCPCSTGYFQSSNVCSPCSISCKTCSVLSTNCTSCPTTTSYLSSYQCICNNGYYSNGLICSACDVKCQTCAVTSTSCILCNPLHGTSINGSDCICASNQYQNPTTYICYACSSYCLTCTSSTNYSCLSCHPTTFRTYSALYTACFCSAGYYDSNQLICSACNSPCATCTGASLLNCTSCIAGYTLIGSSCMQQIVCANYYYSGVCLNTCPNTTYPGLNVCMDCINNCLTCTSTSLCTSCKLNFYLHNSVCYSICQLGYYANPINRQCTPCPLECYQCALRNSTVVCTSCNSTYFLKNQSCVSTCPNSTYVVIGQLCKPCLSQCLTCTSLAYNGCLTCSSGHYFYLGMCLLNCPAGYYSSNNLCLPCVSNCTSCTTLGCQTCSTGLYLTLQLNCVEIGYFLNSQGTKQKCHANCMTCTDSSFSSCITCVQYRGDASSLAVSGYCDCWKDSIDVGNGKCDISSFEPIKKANQALVSATSAINYLSLLSGVICVNFFAPVVSISYQQLYSNFYYLNSSSVLQTDEVLNQYGGTCFNRMIEKQVNKKVGKYSNAFTRRLQATIQEEQSLFMRGYSWRYLIEWAFYTFICIFISWIMCILFSYLFQRIKKTIRKDSAIYKIAQFILLIFRENFMILVHFLTINDIGFYALASFKLLPQQQIQPIRLSFSIALFAYYIGYLIRLFVACIRYTGTEDQQKNLMILFSCFYSQKKKITLSRLYIPMIMLRSLLISTALVFLAFYPVGQIVSSLLIFVIFTIYSFCYCPYYFYLSVFVHIFEVLFIIQLIILTVSIAQPESSRISPAFGLIIFNFLQLLNLVILTVSIIINKVYDIKCWSVKEKRILPFKRETNNQQVHIPVYKERYVPKPQNITEELVYQEEDEDTDKMDYQILQRLPKGKAKPNNKKEDLNAILNRSQLFNSSLNSIPERDISEQMNPRRRRKAKPLEKQHIDIFSLQDVEDEEIEKPRKANKRG